MAKKRSKKRPSRRRPPAEPEVSAELLAVTLELLITLDSHAAVLLALRSDDSPVATTPREAAAALELATQRLAIIARYDRGEHLGRAIARLDNLYKRSVRDGDYGCALRVQQEINRRLKLFDDPADSESGDADSELAAVCEYLQPLFPDAAASPSELARLAATTIASSNGS